MKLRKYSNRNGKENVLITWGQRRCKCGRFLGLRELKLCRKCADITNKYKNYLRCTKYRINNREKDRMTKYLWKERNPEYIKLKNKIYLHVEEFNIGDYV